MDYDRLRELQQKFEENPRRYFAPLANEYRKGGQPKRAIEICRVQLAQMPGHMSGQIVYGQSLYEVGEFDEARQVFERALTLDPENLIALRSLGDMSLQSGNTTEARNWYTRLLDADPKDTAVIALVSEIEASSEAAPVAAPKEIPGVDADAGDQPIPLISDAVPAAPPLTPIVAAEQARVQADAVAQEQPRAQGQARTQEQPRVSEEPRLREPTSVQPTESAPPAGLERHYPVEPKPSFEDEVPLGTEGLHSALPVNDPMAAIKSELPPTAATGAEGLRGNEAVTPEPSGTEGLRGKPPVLPLEGAKATRSDSEEVLDTWTPPPGATVHERAEPGKEERMFSGAAPEPFVNETMAQLYLQQGYRQLALRVYRQLAEVRPNDQALKDRIAQIEAEDRAAHPEEAAQARREPPPIQAAEARREPPPIEAVQARREAPPIERPSAPPASPRSPSIEAPTPGGPAESEEAPSFDRSPVDSPPTRPSRERESIEAPTRDEPRAEPEGIAARQPTVKEFFATLGRRRPPRVTGGGGGGAR